jgi:hypothetical protein
VNQLWITALMAAALALAPGPRASAQSAVEYGGLVSQMQGSGAGKLGSSVNQKGGSWKSRAGSHKQSKAKG